MRTNRRNLRLALTALMLLVLAFSASGAVSVGAQTTSWWTVWYVDDDNCPGPGSGTRSDPFCKIQDAIYAASAGDTISVAEGIYTECLNMPTDNLTMTVGDLADGLVAFDVPQDSEELKVNPDSAWKVNTKERVTACDNRPGLKKIYVTVLDEKGDPLRGVKVRFETEPSEGIAYDHMNIWGLTDENGYLEWNHLGKPTRYMLWAGDDEEAPLIENIRTDLGNEYCKPPGSSWWSGNVPVNRPGIYSYRIEIQKKG